MCHTDRGCKAIHTYIHIQLYAAETCFRALQSEPVAESMLKCGGYILGEFGNTISHKRDTNSSAQFQLLRGHFLTCETVIIAVYTFEYGKFTYCMCLYVYMYVYSYAHKWGTNSSAQFQLLRGHIHTYMHTCIYMYMCVHTYILSYTQIETKHILITAFVTYTYTYIHTYSHAYIH